MADALRLAGYREPLGLSVRQGSRIAARPDLRVQELEFSSRGDRVTGRLVLPPEGGGPHPLLLVQHAVGGSAAEVLAAVGTAWAEAGVALAAIDLPLHGGRADRKLLDWLRADRGERTDTRRRALALEFARQSVIDAERALDALTSLAWIDPERIACLGFGLGAHVAGAFCALDPRPAAAALAPGGECAFAPELDPRLHLGRVAPRPLLWVGLRGDPTGTADAVAAAHVQRVVVDGAPADLPRSSAPAVRAFLAPVLGA